MKDVFSKIRYLIFFLALFNVLKLQADNYPGEKTPSLNSELLIESNSQSSDLENSIFYAEGDVIITNNNKDFIAKSKKAIFYKLIGKIQLIGNVEVLTNDKNNIKAGEVIYFLKENRFEAVADQTQKVNTIFKLNENNIIDETEEI